MKKLGILFAFLIVISGAVASVDAQDDEWTAYEDPHTGFSVIRYTENFETGNHQVCEVSETDEDDDEVEVVGAEDIIKAEFNLELTQDGAILIKGYNEFGGVDDAFLAVLGYLKNEGCTIFGDDSNVFLSDTMDNKIVRAAYGFKPTNEVLEEIPESLASLVDTLYVRHSKISIDIGGGQSVEL
ncbi:MAG: hypothetical protein K2Q34_05970 [Alphaproteobacteria bacterium]|nr:hypothetical protein [Alphaproteobacteria bacterium]